MEFHTWIHCINQHIKFFDSTHCYTYTLIRSICANCEQIKCQCVENKKIRFYVLRIYSWELPCHWNIFESLTILISSLSLSHLLTHMQNCHQIFLVKVKNCKIMLKKQIETRAENIRNHLAEMNLWFKLCHQRSDAWLIEVGNGDAENKI